MSDDYYKGGSTHCGRCGAEFPGGGVGSVFCPSCYTELRLQQGMDDPMAKKPVTPEDPAKDLGTSGFRTL